jgi:hypothetical protein
MKDIIGSGARIRCVIHDGVKTDLMGLTVDDLFERRGDELVPRDPSLVHTDTVARNKMLKRGLSYWMLVALYGHSSVTTAQKVPSDITFGETRNPFLAFMVFADKGIYPADARPEWNESDGERDGVIPDGLAPHTPEEGKRGVLLTSSVDGDFLKRQSSGYVSTNPHREYEFVVYARATQTHVKATGQISIDTYGSIANADTIVLNDGINPSVTIEFDITSPGTTVAGRVRAYIGTASSNNDVRDTLIAAINAVGDGLYMSAAIGSGDGKVDLTHTAGGTVGNGDGTGSPPAGINITGVTGGVSKTNMSGGTGAEGADGSNGNKEIDNLPIKAFGFAYGVECGGQVENESNLGLRAVQGLRPWIQGVCDRVYIGEVCTFGALGAGSITNMKNYGGTTDTVTQDGYVVDSELAEVLVADCANAPVITPANNSVAISSAEWDLPATIGFKAGVHERLYLKFTGGTHDGEYHKIKQVIDSRNVEVFTSLTADDATSVDVIRRYTGVEAFDGKVDNEGLTTQVATSSDPIATVIPGGKWSSIDTGGHEFGRVFNAAKNIKGVRVIFPAGVTKDKCPHKFKIQTLDPTANANDPRPGVSGDWIDLPATQHDYLTANFQADAIYDAGRYGVEYVFTNPVTTKGVKLAQILPFDNTVEVEIAELMVFEEAANITLSDEYLRFSVDNGVLFKRKAIPDVAASNDYQQHVDALNAVLSGYQVEAIRSNFGYLWFRGTVAGDNSDLDLSSDNTVDGSTCLVKLGLAPDAATSPSRTGITQSVLKRTVDALTFIVRFNMTTDHPQP